MMKKIKQEIYETKVLFRSLPAVPFAILCVSFVAMNFLAGKGIVPAPWDEFIQLDAGIIVSWITFLASDVIVKHFGAKASIKVNICAVLVQMFTLSLLTIGSFLPWSGAYTEYEATFDAIFRMSMWPLLAGTTAFIVAVVVNSLINKFILVRLENKNSFKAYAIASYTSTAVGQFLDNLLFALLFSIWQPWFTHHSAIWMFAFVGMLMELLFQVVFSPVGYWITQRWRKNEVGKEYIELVQDAQDVQ